MVVGRHLHLHVTSVGHEALHVEPLVAEGRARLRNRDPEQLAQLLGGVRELDPAPATSARSLEQHRIARLRGEGLGVRQRCNLATGHEGQERLQRRLARA